MWKTEKVRVCHGQEVQVENTDKFTKKQKMDTKWMSKIVGFMKIRVKINKK